MDDIMNPATFNSLIARLEEFEDKLPAEPYFDELYELQEDTVGLV